MASADPSIEQPLPESSPLSSSLTSLDLARLVVVGDSLAAGYMNASLAASGQKKGFASRIARSAGAALPLPLIAEPGIPNRLELVTADPAILILPARGVSRGRLEPSLQPMNLAVPGARVADTLTARPGAGGDVMTDLVLGFPGLLRGISRSQLEWAESLRPSTIIVWIGSNDVLRAALSGNPGAVTPASSFKASYREMLARLSATGPTVIVANIPDVTVVPLLNSRADVAEALSLPAIVLGPLLGLGPDDLVTPAGVAAIGEIVSGRRSGPLPDEAVLDAGEIAAIRSAVDDFNAFIAAEAADRGALLIDLHARIEDLRQGHERIGRRPLTTRYLGGFFSLDGIHPSITGHAVIADAFVRAINARFGSSLPAVPVTRIAGTDPLFLPRSKRPASSFGLISDAALEALLRLLAR